MLVLTRKVGESISIDNHIKIRVVQLRGKQVRLGIEAPKETRIDRQEVRASLQGQELHSMQRKTDNMKSMAYRIFKRLKLGRTS